MIRKHFVMLIALACSACGARDPRATPAQAYRHWSDKFTVAIGLLPFSCTYKVKDKFGEYYASIPTNECVEFEPPRRWRGLWRDEFEGSAFCPAPAAACGYIDPEQRTQPLIWLEVERGMKEPSNGGLYSIDFIGRKSKFRGEYGQVGMSDEEVIVDRIISMKQIEAPLKRK